MEQCGHIVIERVHVLHKPFISFVVNLKKHSENVGGKMYMKEELSNLVTKHIIHKLGLQYKEIKTKSCIALSSFCLVLVLF